MLRLCWTGRLAAGLAMIVPAVSAVAGPKAISADCPPEVIYQSVPTIKSVPTETVVPNGTVMPEGTVAPDGTAAPTEQPNVVSDDLTMSTTDSLDFAAAQNVGGSSESQFSPNMFGDIYGGSRIRGAAGSSHSARTVSPGQGGFVGRTKVSDWNSPIPVDRVFFRYDYFDNAKALPEDHDVQRMVFGVERSFLCGRASVEVQVPFALTADFQQDFDNGYSADVELGNVYVTLKGVLLQTCTTTVSAGLGIDLPTADDLEQEDPAGGIVIENDSIALTPFIAMIQQRDRLFFQAWSAISFDLNGNPVLLDGAGGLGHAGRFNEQQLWQTDVQLGYWVVQNPCACGLQGLAPYVELHYNTPISAGDNIDAAGIFVDPNFDEVNLGLGAHAVISDSIHVSTGWVAPLNHGDDRFFDWQLGFRGEVRFGGGCKRDTECCSPCDSY